MSSNSILYYNYACQNTSFCSHILLLLASICYLCDRQSWLSAGANVFFLFFFFVFDRNTLTISFFAIILNKSFVRLDSFCLVQRVQQIGTKICNSQNKTPTNRYVLWMIKITRSNFMFCVNKNSMKTKIILL